MREVVIGHPDAHGEPRLLELVPHRAAERLHDGLEPGLGIHSRVNVAVDHEVLLTLLLVELGLDLRDVWVHTD